ncbi:MAG: oligopeptide/dipeptide transporter, ATP-binding protein, partial [Bacteriovoracaceae bacterium]|nr:oligopeptide/dipeptide transporter, ATP-binding protein [Bacteriovoracaceae bacterium]
NQRREKVYELLSIVGLRRESYDKYPHEFSGGQRQRIGIARALAVKPDFIVADEPVSALDVSIQAQILNLMKKLQAEFHLTYLFISHDLNVIRYLCDRVVVMYLGRIMEILTREQLLDPNYKKHPYTTALIAAAPKKHPDENRLIPPLQGDIPSPARPPNGCVFNTRCPEAIDSCRSEIPLLKSSPDQKHFVACHLRAS